MVKITLKAKFFDEKVVQGSYFFVEEDGRPDIGLFNIKVTRLVIRRT